MRQYSDSFIIKTSRAPYVLLFRYTAYKTHGYIQHFKGGLEISNNLLKTISVGRMILSPNLSVCDTILDSLKLILKYFDQTILDNLQPATHTNIDLQIELFNLYCVTAIITIESKFDYHR